MKNWKLPKMPYEIRSFLGLAVYYDTPNQGLGYVFMQRGKIELFSDYDCEIHYHPGKANVVADAFSRKERVKLRRVRAMSMTIRSSITDKILAAQGEASKDRIPLIGDVRTIIMDETYASRRKPLEFEVGDQVLLKLSPWKGVVRFRKKGKLAPRYVGPFEILERISPLAYRLRLPQLLSSVHDTFHVSNMKKCLADSNLHVPLGEVKIDKTLLFVKEHVVIMYRKVRKLKRSRIPTVKVC
ncbi:hypothetical protein Tco_0734600 [Tanacetum coccineum]